ncbi:RNA-binding protein [Candidatus Bathyarchaeota archaeon]|nr:MAG: RNA-binding protein [Candidatus Bathyarchaeota archaeon]
MSEDERIYVGSKPILSYVTAVVTALQRADSVKVLARGRAISSAVDVVEVTKRSFMTDIAVDDISIGTERLGEGDAARNVSTIAITLSRQKS